MPKLYAPHKMSIATLSGYGVTLAAGETRDVHPDVFAQGIQQGAYPVFDGAPPTAPSAPVVRESVQKELFAPVGLEGATVVGEEDDQLEDRYPPQATVAPVLTTPTDDEIIEALRVIVKRAEPKEFNGTGIPRATALSRQLGGRTVDAETRERLWATVAKEIST